jgi:hypothetical protein
LSSELSIDHNVTIRGPGAGQLTIDGNKLSRIFDISGASHVSISGLTLANGVAGASSPHPGEGGAIYDDGGHLSLRNVVLPLASRGERVPPCIPPHLDRPRR